MGTHRIKNFPALSKYSGSHKSLIIKIMKMKKHIFNFLLASILFAGCTKNDGPVPDGVALDRVFQPQVVKNGGSAAIDMTNLAGFQGKFDVGVFRTTDIPPAKYDVVIRKNIDNTNIKVFQAGVTALPTTLTITAAQLATLFGAPITLGDNYDIGVDFYTQSGTKYEAFPAIGVGYGSGVANQPGTSTSIRYSAICQYNPAIYEGNFVVIEDEFQDLLPGDVVVLTRIDDTHFSYIYPSGINPKPIIVTVNPLTNAVTIAKQKFGTAFTWEPAYTNPNAETANSLLNVVSPCAQEWGALINYTVDQGNFGNFYLKMKKQ
jgi:hypothetical protein